MATKRKKTTTRRRRPLPRAPVALPASRRAPRRNTVRRAARAAQSAGVGFGKRVKGMAGAHVATAAVAGGAAQALAVWLVHRGTVTPRVAAGTMVGAGVAGAAAGYYTKSDHVLAGGLGLTAAGSVNLASVFLTEAYEAQSHKRALAAAQEQAQLTDGKPRNADPDPDRLLEELDEAVRDGDLDYADAYGAREEDHDEAYDA